MSLCPQPEQEAAEGPGGLTAEGAGHVSGKHAGQRGAGGHPGGNQEQGHRGNDAGWGSCLHCHIRGRCDLGIPGSTSGPWFLMITTQKQHGVQ